MKVSEIPFSMVCLVLVLCSNHVLLLPVPQSLGLGLLGVAACVVLMSIVALAVVCTKHSRVEPKV